MWYVLRYLGVLLTFVFAYCADAPGATEAQRILVTVRTDAVDAMYGDAVGRYRRRLCHRPRRRLADASARVALRSIRNSEKRRRGHDRRAALARSPRRERADPSAFPHAHCRDVVPPLAIRAR